MSLFTSNSEFDAEKHIQITNEMPPYDMYTGVNSVLQNDMWKWFLGYTKVTTDVDYNSNPALTYTKKTNGNQSEVYGPKPKNLYTIDGRPIHTIPKFRSLEVNGALSVEQDLFLHEIYRYLDTLYPDHYDWRHLLTNNEINDAFTNAAAVVDYKPNNDFFDLVARNLEGIETEDEIEVESLKIKLRNLRNNAYRRKLYGSKIGYRMFCGDIFQLCSIYPLGTYTTLQPIDKDVLYNGLDEDDISIEQINSHRKIDTLNQNYSKKFKLIDWENDLSIYEDIKNKKNHFKFSTIPGYDDIIFEVPNNLKEDATIDNLKIGMNLFSTKIDEESLKYGFKNIDNISVAASPRSEYPVYASTASTEESSNNIVRADDPELLSKFYGYMTNLLMTIDCDLQDKAYFVWRKGKLSLEDVESITMKVTKILEDGSIEELKEFTVEKNKNVNEIDNGDVIRLIFDKTEDSSEPTLVRFELIEFNSVQRQSLLQVNSVKTTGNIAPDFRTVYKIKLDDDTLSSFDDELKSILISNGEQNIIFGDDLFVTQGQWLYRLLHSVDKNHNSKFIEEEKVLYNPYIEGTLFISPEETLKSYEFEPDYTIIEENNSKKAIFTDEGHKLWESESFKLRPNDMITRSTEWSRSDSYDVYGIVDWTRGSIKVETDGTLPRVNATEFLKDREYACVFENSDKKRCLIFGKIRDEQTYNIEVSKFWYSFKLDIHTIPENIEKDYLFNIVYPEYEEYKFRIDNLNRIEATTPDLFDIELEKERDFLQVEIKRMESSKGNREYILDTGAVDSDNTQYSKFCFGLGDKLVYVFELFPNTETWTKRIDVGSYNITNINYGCLSVMPYIHNSKFVYPEESFYKRRDYVKNRYTSALSTDNEKGQPIKICIQDFDFEPLRAHRRNLNELPYGAFESENKYMFWGVDDNTNMYSQNIDSIEVEVLGVIDITSEELKSTITFNDDISLEKMRSFNVGDYIRGPQILNNDTYITEVGLDFIKVNNVFIESGSFKYIVNATNKCIPLEIDKFNSYKTEQYSNGHYDKVNIFNTSIYPSKGWPETAKNTYISGLLDISQFEIYNNSTFQSFKAVMESVYYDHLFTSVGEVKEKNNFVWPAIIKFENDIFIELNIRGLIKTPNKRGLLPNLMIVDYLDYIENNLYNISRATDSVSVGASLVLNTDTSGKFSLIENSEYTDPSILSKFQTFNWDKDTVPAYAQIGEAGENYQSLFIIPEEKRWPNVYGVAVWDGREDFYERYQKAQQVDLDFVLGKRHNWTSLTNTLENFTKISFKKDVEKPLFEIPLGEYDIQLNYENPLSSKTVTTVQSNFYKQSFKNILIKNKEFSIKSEDFISNEFIVGNKNALVTPLTDNPKYNLLEHNYLGTYDFNIHYIGSIPDHIIYPDIKDDYKIGDFFLIERPKQLKTIGIKDDPNFKVEDTYMIESPSLLFLDYDKNGNKYWKYCVFKLAGTWGSSRSANSFTMPVKSTNFSFSTPTRKTMQLEDKNENGNIAYYDNNNEPVYWTRAKGEEMQFSGRDLLDAFAIKIARCTTNSSLNDQKILEMIKYQFTKEDLFCKEYRIDNGDSEFQTIEDEQSIVYMLYYSGNNDQSSDFFPEELKDGSIEPGDIICVYIYRLKDQPESDSNVISCSKDDDNLGYLEILVGDFLTDQPTYKTKSISTPKWGLSSFVIKKDNIWSAKLPLNRELGIEDFDWNILIDETQPASPLNGIEKNFNLIELPRGAINPGSENAEFVLDPKLKGIDKESYLNGEKKSIDISSYPIKYDKDRDDFYISPSGNDQDKQIIHFNENKFFKNILRLRGSYQTINLLNENNVLEKRGILSPISGEAWESSLVNNNDYVLSFNEVKLRSNWTKTLEPVIFKSLEKIEGKILGFGENGSCVISGRDNSEISGIGNGEFSTKLNSILPSQDGLIEITNGFTDFNKSTVLSPKAKNVKITSTAKLIHPNKTFEDLLREPNVIFFKNLGVGEFTTNFSSSNILNYNGSIETERLVGLLNSGDTAVQAHILTKLSRQLIDCATLDENGAPMVLDGFLNKVVFTDTYVYFSTDTGKIYQVFGKNDDVGIRKLEFLQGANDDILREYELTSATTTIDDEEIITLTKTDFNSSYNQITNPLSQMFKIILNDKNQYVLDKWTPTFIEESPVLENGLIEMPSDTLFPEDISVSVIEGANLNILTSHNAGQSVFGDDGNVTTTYSIDFLDKELNVRCSPPISDLDKYNKFTFYYDISSESEKDLFENYFLTDISNREVSLTIKEVESESEIVSDDTDPIDTEDLISFAKVVFNDTTSPDIEEVDYNYNKISLYKSDDTVIHYIAKTVLEDGYGFNITKKYNNDSQLWEDSQDSINFEISNEKISIIITIDTEESTIESTSWSTQKSIDLELKAGTLYGWSYDTRLPNNGKIKSCLSIDDIIILPSIKDISVNDKSTWPEIELNIETTTSKKVPMDFGKLGSLLKFNKDRDRGVYIDGNNISIYGKKTPVKKVEGEDPQYDDLAETVDLYWTKSVIPFSSEDTRKSLSVYSVEAVETKLKEEISNTILSYLSIADDYSEKNIPEGARDSYDPILSLINETKPLIEWLYGSSSLPTYDNATINSTTNKSAINVINKVESDPRWKYSPTQLSYTCNSFGIIDDIAVLNCNDSDKKVWNSASASESYIDMAADIFKYVLGNTTSTLLNNIVEDVIFTESNIIIKTILNGFFGISYENTKKKSDLDKTSNWFEVTFPKYLQTTAYELISAIDQNKQFNTTIKYKININSEEKEVNMLSGSNLLNIFEPTFIRKKNSDIFIGGYRFSADDVIRKRYGDDRFSSFSSEKSRKENLGDIYFDGKNKRLSDSKVTPILLLSKDGGKTFEEINLPNPVSSYEGMMVNSMVELDGSLFITLFNSTILPNPNGDPVNNLHNKYFKIYLLDTVDGSHKKYDIEELSDGNEGNYDFFDVDLLTTSGSYGDKKLIPLTKNNSKSTELKKSKMMQSQSISLGDVLVEKIDGENKRIILNNPLISTAAVQNQNLDIRILISFDTKNNIKYPMNFIDQSKIYDYLSVNGGFFVPFSKSVSSNMDADLAYMKNEWNYYTNMPMYSLELRDEPGISEEDISYYPSTFKDKAYFFSKDPIESISEIPSKEGLVPNNERLTYYNWIDDQPEYFVNKNGTPLKLCSEDGLMVVTKNGIPFPISNMIDLFNADIYVSCPKPKKSHLEFLKSDIVTKDDIIINELLKDIEWKDVQNVSINDYQSIMTINFGEDIMKFYKDDIFFTDDDDLLVDDNLSEKDLEFYNFTSTSIGPIDITDYHSSEDSRYKKYKFGEYYVWIDSITGITPLKRDHNISFDISIPYKYSGQSVQKYTEIDISDNDKIKSISDSIPVTGMYFTPPGYGGTRTQTAWSTYPWENDIVAFNKKDDEFVEASNEFNGKVLLCDLDGSAIINKSNRIVEPNEIVHLRSSDLDKDWMHSYSISTDDGLLTQTVIKDFIVGKDTQIIKPIGNNVDISLKYEEGKVHNYDNEIVGYLRITDGYDDINVEYIESVIFEYLVYDSDDRVIGKNTIPELQWNDNKIFANGSLDYINNEVVVTVTFTNNSRNSINLVADVDNSDLPDIDDISWEELKYSDDNLPEIIYSLKLNDSPLKMDNWKPFIVTAGIAHNIDLEIPKWDGEYIDIKQHLSYYDQSVQGKFISEKSSYIENVIGPVYVKQPKYKSFNDLLINEGTSINWSSSLGSSGERISSLKYDLGKISGETVINGRSYIIFDKYLNNDYLNNGDAHIIEMELLTESTINLTKQQMNDKKNYYEVPLSFIEKFTPDRIYFHPEGYPMSPVTYKGKVFFSENGSYYNNSYYKNMNGSDIILCNEEGSIEKYVLRNNELILEPIPVGYTYNDSELAIIRTPKYTSCKEWYREEFYVEGESQNPFWHYVKLNSIYNSNTKKFETKLEYQEKYKDSGFIKYRSVDDGKYINIYNTSYIVYNNGVFVLNDTAFNYKTGEVRLIFLEGDDSFVNNDSFVKYGIYAFKNEIETKSAPIESTINVRDIVLDYDCNTLENTINPLDRDKAITQITEFGLFDKFHNMIAYATFPPIEYRSDTQHVSIISIITNGNHTPLEEN